MGAKLSALQTLDEKYINCKLIGRGSSSHVYLVRRKVDNKHFAVKIPSTSEENMINEDSFLKEVGGRSKYIIRLEDSFRDSLGRVILV